MTAEETKAIYEAACKASAVKRVATSEEGKAWHRTLREFEPCDVEAALDERRADQTLGSDGQPRSKWFPSPGELLPIVVRIRDERLRRSAAPKDYIRFACTKCQFTCGGWFLRGDTPPPVHCRLNSTHPPCAIVAV